MNFTQKRLFSNVPLDRNRPRRVVFYGRVSTQHDAQLEALENQMQWYEDQAQRHPNWTVVNRYIDEGITGTLVNKRPALLKMLEDAHRRQFDLIVTREICRFARNTVDSLSLTRELSSIGVEVFFVEDNIWTMDNEGELRLSLMSTLAQEESRKISERVRAGQAVSRENGVLYGNGNILGYDLVEGNYVINEEQADTVRTVYRLYSQGMGEKVIVNELSRLGCKDTLGHVNWNCPKVSRILRNATYMGYIGYNKSKTADYLSKRRVRNLDEDSYVYVKGSFEPIVSEELWHKCESIRKGRISVMRMPDGELRRKGVRDSRLLWVRKLRCRCGCSFRKFNWSKRKDGTPVVGYQCVRRTDSPSAAFVEAHGLTEQIHCDAIAVGEWKLEMMAHMVFSRVWGDSKETILRACEMVEECAQDEAQDSRRRQRSLARQKEQLKQRKLSYSRMRADGDLELADYRKLMAEVREEMEALEQPEKEEQVEKKYDVDMAELRAAMERVLDMEKAKVDDELIDEFVEVVTPYERYGYRWKLNFGKPKNKYERADMMAVTEKPILRFTIGYDEARDYRALAELPVQQFRRSSWNDIKVEVYL